jgi:hypothetical protein
MNIENGSELASENQTKSNANRIASWPGQLAVTSSESNARNTCFMLPSVKRCPLSMRDLDFSSSGVPTNRSRWRLD